MGGDVEAECVHLYECDFQRGPLPMSAALTFCILIELGNTVIRCLVLSVSGA